MSKVKEMLEKQGGVCAICGGSEPKDAGTGHRRRFAVDHCHETGRVRGLLCVNCNSGIGKLKDSPDLLRRALDYLSQPA